MALLYVAENNTSRQNRVFKDRIGLENLRNFEIMSRYRLDRASIAELTDLIRDTLNKSTRRSHSISPEIQVLVGLRFLAKGSFYSEVADLHGISRSSVCIALNDFVDAVNDKLDNIRFPVDSLNDIKYGFFRKCGLPNVIGAVDGTLIPIQAPNENEAAFVCRKGYHAINMQAVVDSNMRFMDIVAKWPGSQHDSFIFNNSGIKSILERRDIGYLLGDSGYPLKSYLITPLLSTSSTSEMSFNTHHCSGRSVIEKAFGVLKSRFRCLHKSGGCLLLKPAKCCKVIEACVRMHNFCQDRQVPFNEHDLVTDNDDDQAGHSAQQITLSSGGSDRRQSLVNLFNLNVLKKLN